MQYFQGFFGLAHDEVFGDFQLQATGLQVVVPEQLLDAPQQVGMAQLGTGEVDGEWAKVVIGLAPLVQLSASLFQDPVADLQDHAVFFGQGDEVFGRHVAEGRVAPADQGFGADQLLGLQAQLGLVIQKQFFAL